MSVDVVDYSGNSLSVISARPPRPDSRSRSNTMPNDRQPNRSGDDSRNSLQVPHRTTPKLNQRAMSENPRKSHSSSYMDQSMTSSYRRERMNLGVRIVNEPYHGPAVHPTWRNWREEYEQGEPEKPVSEYPGTNADDEPQFPPYSSTEPRAKTPAVVSEEAPKNSSPYTSSKAKPRLETINSAEDTSTKTPDKTTSVSDAKNTEQANNKEKTVPKSTQNPPTQTVPKSTENPPAQTSVGKSKSMKKKSGKSKSLKKPKCSIM